MGAFCVTLYSQNVEVIVVAEVLFEIIYLHEILNSLQINVHRLMDSLHSFHIHMCLSRTVGRGEGTHCGYTRWNKFDFSEAEGLISVILGLAVRKAQSCFRVTSNILPCPLYGKYRTGSALCIWTPDKYGSGMYLDGFVLGLNVMFLLYKWTLKLFLNSFEYCESYF